MPGQRWEGYTGDGERRRSGPCLGWDKEQHTQKSNKDAKNLPREVKHGHEACGLTDGGWSKDQDTRGSGPWMSHYPV